MNYLGNDYFGSNSNQQRIDSLSERNRNPERKQFSGLKFHDSPDGTGFSLFTIGHLEIHVHVPKAALMGNLLPVFFQFFKRKF